MFDAEEAASKMLLLLSSTTEGGTRIKLHGGEPFMVFSKIRYFCERLWQAGLDEEFMIHCTTNGTLIHGHIQEWLTDHKNQICVKLSLDGDRLMQNANRPGSFDKIDFDFFLRTWPDIEIKMTVSPKTAYSFARGVIFLHEKGFRYISPSFAEMMDWSDKELPRVFYRELSKLNNYYLSHPDINPCSWFTLSLSRLYSAKDVSFPCRIGTKSAIDLQSGMDYPCHLFFDSVLPQLKVRELLKINLDLRENIVSKDCDGCAFLPICHTCYVANYISRGHTASRDMDLCILQKCLFVAVSELYYARIIRKDSWNITPDDYATLYVVRDLLPTLKQLKEAFS